MEKTKCRVAVRFRNKEEERQCTGKFVATPSFNSNRVIQDEKGNAIASGNPAAVARKVDVMGFEQAVIVFIPKNNCWIYGARKSA